MIALLLSIALASECDAGDDAVAVYFGNGMFNLHSDAIASMYALDTRLHARLPEETFTTRLSYNVSEGALAQLVQVLVQKVVDDRTHAIATILGVFVPEADPGTIASELGAIAGETVLSDSTLQSHVQSYRASLLAGQPVVLLGHSQGNLYANAAWDAVMAGEEGFSQDSMKLVGAASPASRVAGGGEHTTATDDWVISAVRAAYPDTLPATGQNRDRTGQDWLNHGFVETYLGGDELGDEILDDVSAAFATVEYPAAQVSDGVITVTIEWDEQPDVDLHVFEPDGGHVYYADLVGTYGYLDYDDTSGFGPEHYYVSCEDLAALEGEGVFSVGVNYYAGDAPTSGTMQIEAGYETRTFPFELASARGGGGDGSPEILADVVVRLREGGGFDVAIE